jgi:hypothetical protein
MKAKLSAMCGICGRSMCMVNEDGKTLGPIFCVNNRCTEFKRQYEPPTVLLSPVHAK